MVDNQPGSAASSCGGVGTDDTTLIEVVEPSSFEALGDRLPFHLTSSCSAACFVDTQTTAKSFNVLAEEPEQVERDATSQTKKAEKT